MTVSLRRPAAVLTVVASVLGAGAVAVVLAPAARADTPQAQAAALAAQVRQLQDQAEQVTEQYDQAQGELGLVVAQKIQAERSVTAAQQAVGVQQQVNVSTIRSVYEMGGPASLYVGVLSAGGDPSEVQSGLAAVGRVVAAGQARTVALQAATTTAQAAQAAADELAHRETALESEVAARAATIQEDLARTQTLLDAADEQVRELAAQAEAAREAAQQQQFLQTLAGAADGTLSAAASAQYAALLTGAPPPSSPIAGAALAAAEALQGHPYQWGGTGPVGYDCSGMTGAAYAAAGLRLPRTAAQQYQAGPHVPLADIAPGDLLFWASDPSNPATIEHVAIYAGKGLMVSADHTGDTVRLQPVWFTGYAGATRPTAGAAAVVPGPFWAPGQTG